MKLRGSFDSSVTYDVGDIVRYENGDVCILQKPCAAGITPLDTLFWGRADNITTAIVNIALDAVALGPQNISDEAITLKTDNGEYLITVDDSGDTPELEVTAIEEE